MKWTYLLLFSLIIIISTSFNKPTPKYALLLIGTNFELKGGLETMDSIESIFNKQGITCYKFFDGDSDWSKIVKVSSKCSYLVYMGHGTTKGDNGYGGLCLVETISSEKIRNELNLKPGAIILFQSVCGASGSSASDNSDIGKEEAKKRVLSYSKPFMDEGAILYYSNNYSSGLLDFLNKYFSGIKVSQIYFDNNKYFTKQEFWEPLSDSVNFVGVKSYIPQSNTFTRTTTYSDSRGNVEVKTETIKSFKKYPVAFVGDPNLVYVK